MVNDDTKYSLGFKRTVVSVISGVGAGLACTITCAPLDVAKVRMQVQGSLGVKKYDGVLSSVARIYKEEGARGLFRGVGPALITIPLFWGVYWPIYNRLKVQFEEEYPHRSPYMWHVMSAICAGGISDIITNPFWVVRTRIQTLALHPELKLSSNISTFQMFRAIYRDEGVVAFYRGLGASILGLSHVAIQFPLCKSVSNFCRQLTYIYLGRIVLALAIVLYSKCMTCPFFLPSIHI